MKQKFYVEIFVSKKGNKCATLKVDLGYARRSLTFDSSIIAEILGISVADLMSRDVGVYTL